MLWDGKIEWQEARFAVAKTQKEFNGLRHRGLAWRLEGMKTGERFERAVEIMHRLRAPGGCPWDREQTFDSITKYTVEETYEVLEAIEQRDWEELPGELGDLLLQVLFYAEMAEEAGHFSIDTVLETLSEKLVRRHPHVFGEVEAGTSQEVLKNWEAIKRQERAAKAAGAGKTSGNASLPAAGAGNTSGNASLPAAGAGADNASLPAAGAGLLDSVKSSMPALMEGMKLSKKAAGVGFDWPSIDGLFDKLQEEAGELRREVEQIPEPGPVPAAGAVGAVSVELHGRLQDEIGDLLFTVVNLARYLQVDPELALRQTNRKFRRRFGQVELGLRAMGKELGQASLAEMERMWEEAKEGEV